MRGGGEAPLIYTFPSQQQWVLYGFKICARMCAAHIHIHIPDIWAQCQWLSPASSDIRKECRARARSRHTGPMLSDIFVYGTVCRAHCSSGRGFEARGYLENLISVFLILYTYFWPRFLLQNTTGTLTIKHYLFLKICKCLPFYFTEQSKNILIKI